MSSSTPTRSSTTSSPFPTARPPRVSSSRQPAFKVPANVKVDLVMAVHDDHGVKDATLHVMLGNENLVSKNLLEGRQPQPEFKAVETLDLAKLRRETRFDAQLLAHRRDNKEPSSNRTDTARQVIEVTEPVSPPRRKSSKKARRKTAIRSICRLPRTSQPPDKTSPSESDEADEQNRNPRRQAARLKPTKRPRANEKPAADSGTVDETDRKPQDGTNDNQTPLTPEDQRNYEKLRQLLNNKSQQNPAGSQANPAGSQQQHNPRPVMPERPIDPRAPALPNVPKAAPIPRPIIPASVRLWIRPIKRIPKAPPAAGEWRVERPVKSGPAGKPRWQCPTPRLPRERKRRPEFHSKTAGQR